MKDKTNYMNNSLIWSQNKFKKNNLKFITLNMPNHSNYFNDSNINTDDYWGHDKGIYPTDWLYPYRNIFSGINGQDPVYVYDGSEFFVYSFLLPALVGWLVWNRTKLFHSKRKSNIFYWVVWYVALWTTFYFPMGLLGPDFLVFSVFLGAILLGLYGYDRIKEKKH